MANLNKVFLIGNLTRDPELRQLPSGTSLCSFGMAINRMQTLASGEQREEVCYVDLVAIGRQGEVIHQYSRKGSPLFVEGRLYYEQWDDRETGKKRSRLSIRVERSQFIGSPAQQTEQGAYGERPAYAQAPAGVPGYGAPRTAAPSPNFAPPPSPAPAYGGPAPAVPSGGMPAFQPKPETFQGTPVPDRNPAVAPAPERRPESTSAEVEDDIPF